MAYYIDEITEQEIREQLQDIGCDKEFIEITLDEIRGGESVEVCGTGGFFSFTPGLQGG